MKFNFRARFQYQFGFAQLLGKNSKKYREKLAEGPCSAHCARYLKANFVLVSDKHESFEQNRKLADLSFVAPLADLQLRRRTLTAGGCAGRGEQGGG